MGKIHTIINDFVNEELGIIHTCNSRFYFSIQIAALVFAAVEKCILVSLMFAWLKMADICNSAFDGGDTYYDIELMDELEWNIWFASVTLRSERVPTLDQS